MVVKDACKALKLKEQPYEPDHELDDIEDPKYLGIYS